MNVKQVLEDMVISMELMQLMDAPLDELRVFLEGLSKDELQRQFLLLLIAWVQMTP